MSETVRRAAVIDIGSNSVRLVVFDVVRSAMLPTFNEKVMAGLGRGLSETGRLSQEGRALALTALRRYRAILDALAVGEVRAVATAAVRVASDGEAFAREAALAAGVPLSILSGSDEGRLSAGGVLAGFRQPQGLVGDLGGSSLELHPVGERDLVAGETHMLGPLALAQLQDAPPRRVREAVGEVFSGSAAVRAGAPRIYAVGGAWRAIAKVHMKIARYPLAVLHGYTLPAEQVMRVTKHIVAERKAGGLSDIAGRRSASLHLTAIVLSELVQHSGAGEVVISSYGLREGVISDLIGDSRNDPLIDGAIAFANLSKHQVAFGSALFDFISPLFPEATDGNGRARLLRTACLLADSAARMHPDYRAEAAFELALHAPLAGLCHAERIFIARALAARYSRNYSISQKLLALASDKQVERAFLLGQAMRLGAVFSGRSAEILKQAQISRSNSRLVFELPRAQADLVSETVERRLAQTASGLGLKPQVELV